MLQSVDTTEQLNNNIQKTLYSNKEIFVLWKEVRTLGQVEQGEENQRSRGGLTEKMTLESSPIGDWVERAVLQQREWPGERP